MAVQQGKGPSGDKSWWEQRTNPSFPSPPTATTTASSSAAAPSAAAAPRQNPFLKGGEASEVKAAEATYPVDQARNTGDQRNPRKEFEAGLRGAVSHHQRYLFVLPDVKSA